MKLVGVLFISISLCACLVHGWFPSSPPDYCSKNIASKSIPPLSADELAQVTELKQVQVMIRHGARTPYALFPCWKDYDVTWNNCNVTELMIESPSMTSPKRPASWLFRKLYDGSATYLGGNCLTGQLISEGYEQEMINGETLYNAYIEGALPLFSTDQWEELNSTTEIYLRSDDEQRTLMSGQILLHSLFNVSDEVIVPWHTGDYNLDQIYPNSNVCPRLNTIEDAAYATPEWQAENTSTAINQLTANLDQIWGAGYWSWYTALDCMMTTVCTGRPLPDGSADTVLMTDEIFSATVAQSEYTYAYPSLYNNSQWAKYATGNTAWHMRTNLEGMISGTGSASSDVPLKFALFSAHDTSLMPFLAAVMGDLWDGRWAGYAYMITIELYSASAASDLGVGGHYFRLYYNGEILTVPGCSAQLCDVNVLLDRLSYGQENMPCSVSSSDVTTNGDSGCDGNDDPGQTDWIIIVLLTFLLGGLIGAATVVFVDRRRKLSAQDVEGGQSTHPLHTGL